MMTLFFDKIIPSIHKEDSIEVFTLFVFYTQAFSF